MSLKHKYINRKNNLNQSFKKENILIKELNLYKNFMCSKKFLILKSKKISQN